MESSPHWLVWPSCDGLIVPVLAVPKVQMEWRKVDGIRDSKALQCNRLRAVGAPSVMAIDPNRKPTEIGVKVTLIAQLPPAGTDAPHELVWVKSPVATIPVMVRGEFPTLLKVII